MRKVKRCGLTHKPEVGFTADSAGICMVSAEKS